MTSFSEERYLHHHRKWVKAEHSGDHAAAKRHLYALRVHLKVLGWLAPQHDRPGLGVYETPTPEVVDNGLRPRTVDELWIKLQAATARVTRLEEEVSRLSQRHRDHHHITSGVGRGDCYDRTADEARRQRESYLR